jgi:hypothetical protein
VRGGLLEQLENRKVNVSECLEPGAKYLIVENGDEVLNMPIPQKRGGVRYAFDLHLNPRAISLSTGREIGTNILLAGQISTLGASTQAAKLFDSFVRAAKQIFTKVKSSYLGDEALRLLDCGCRLTASEKGDPLYDLKRK